MSSPFFPLGHCPKRLMVKLKQLLRKHFWLSQRPGAAVHHVPEPPVPLPVDSSSARHHAARVWEGAGRESPRRQWLPSKLRRLHLLNVLSCASGRTSTEFRLMHERTSSIWHVQTPHTWYSRCGVDGRLIKPFSCRDNHQWEDRC